MLQTKNMSCEVERICEFIREQVGNAIADGVVIGISGGIDSALVAKLCVKALAKDKVHGLIMPYQDQSTKDSELVIKSARIPNRYVNMINIEEPVYSVIKLLPFDSDSDVLIDINNDFVIPGNVRARMRMIMLYAYANKYNLLVAGTGNCSEHMVGYFTKYGDGGTDFEPISHLYKTEVWAMAKYLKLPKKIINKTPSAELWDGQTDEKELGITYKELDRILDYIDEENIYKSIAGDLKISQSKVSKVLMLISKSAHKREVPPGLRRYNY